MSNQYAQGTLIWVRVPQKSRGKTTRGAWIVELFWGQLCGNLCENHLPGTSPAFLFAGL